MGLTDSSVSWSIPEAAGGSISAGGTYTAPQTPSFYHVFATSNADHARVGGAKLWPVVLVILRRESRERFATFLASGGDIRGHFFVVEVAGKKDGPRKEKPQPQFDHVFLKKTDYMPGAAEHKCLFTEMGRGCEQVDEWQPRGMRVFRVFGRSIYTRELIGKYSPTTQYKKLENKRRV